MHGTTIWPKPSRHIANLRPTLGCTLELAYVPATGDARASSMFSNSLCRMRPSGVSSTASNFSTPILVCALSIATVELRWQSSGPSCQFILLSSPLARTIAEAAAMPGSKSRWPWLNVTAPEQISTKKKLSDGSIIRLSERRKEKTAEKTDSPVERPLQIRIDECGQRSFGIELAHSRLDPKALNSQSTATC